MSDEPVRRQWVFRLRANATAKLAEALAAAVSPAPGNVCVSAALRRLRVYAAAMVLAIAAATLAAPHAQQVPARIVSLVPAVTETLFAVGAGPQVVGVSSYDHEPPEVDRLPRVGALLDPDLERVLSLRPDLVVIYGSQQELSQKLRSAGIQTLSYRHGGIAEVLDTIDEVGRATGHVDRASKVRQDLSQQLEAVRARVAGRPRPRVLLVFGRDPGSLRGIYASGGIGFLSDLVAIAGGENVFADVERESVQASTELVLARKPEVIVELRADEIAAGELPRERQAWAALPAIPAVRNGRIVFLTGTEMVMAGPRIGHAAERLARAIHPEVHE